MPVPTLKTPPSCASAASAARDDVADVDVVARLPAVAEDLRRPSVAQQPHEDRDDAGLAVRLLPRPVDVAEAAASTCARPCSRFHVARYSSPASFDVPYGESGRRRRRLGRGPVALAVDRAAGRREDDLRAVAPRRLEDAHRPDDVHVARRSPAARPRRARRPARRGGRPPPGATAVEDARPGSRMSATWSFAPGGDVLALARREVVDDVHLVAARDERIGDVRADEAGASGDDRPHRPRILGAAMGGSCLRSKGSTAPARGRRPRSSPTPPAPRATPSPPSASRATTGTRSASRSATT